MGDFLNKYTEPIFIITIILTMVSANIYKDFDKIISPRKGIVVSKYIIEKNNYHGEPYKEYVLSLYDEFLDDYMSQKFNLIEYYVSENEYNYIEQVPIGYTVSKSAKFKSRN
jgi:hypothetical protein